MRYVKSIVLFILLLLNEVIIMCHIANALQVISDKIVSIPNWISITGVFVPIALSVIVLIMQILQQKSNKQLQKRIYNHEVELKCFDSILQIYSSFSKSVDSLPQLPKNLKERIANKKAWYESLIEIDREMYRKYDFAVLLLGKEDDLTKKLYEKIKEYDDIISSVDNLSTDVTENDEKNLLNLIEQYMKSMNYDNFDQCFSKYINMKHFLETKE